MHSLPPGLYSNCSALCGPAWVNDDIKCVYLEEKCFLKSEVKMCAGVYILSNQACDKQCGTLLKYKLVNIGGLCVPEVSTQLCNGARIMGNSLCNGECYAGAVLTIDLSIWVRFVNVGGVCIDVDLTWTCDGENLLLETACKGSCLVARFRFVNVGGVCINVDLTWTCDGENLLLETACKGSCLVGRFLVNNRCEQEVWMCDRKPQLLEKPCKGSCFSDDFCFSNETCIKHEHGAWSCDKSCENLQSIKKSCNGICPNSKERFPISQKHFSESMSFVYIAGECQAGNFRNEQNSLNWCDGLVIPGNLNCDNTTISSFPFSSFPNCDAKRCLTYCEQMEDGWTCAGECKLNSEPCRGQCSEGQVLMSGNCVFADDTYKCGVETRLREEPCDGRCLTERVYISGKCFPIDETLKCGGKLQYASKPCDGKCPLSKQRRFVQPKNDYDYDNDHLHGENIRVYGDSLGGNIAEYLTDYVKCGDSYLLRSEAWNCDGRCQPHSVPCHGNCLDIICYGRTYEYKMGSCIKIPEHLQCIAGGSFPIYTSATAGVSNSQLDSLGISNLNLLSGSSSLSECPQTYCRKGFKCCKLVWTGENSGLRCPLIC